MSSARSRFLGHHQGRAIRNLFTRENVVRAGRGLRDFFTGRAVEHEVRHEEAVVGIAMARLLTLDVAELTEEPDEQFLQAIRDLYPALREAPVEAIADHFRAYDDAQMAGALNQIKGRMFEFSYVAAENADGDSIVARLHDDPYHPGSDALLTETETGDEWEVSLKTTNSVAYVERALSRYPEIPVVTAAEHALQFEDDPRVDTVDISNQKITEVTEDNFERLLDSAPAIQERFGAMSRAAAVAALIWLWPFVVAYTRRRIRREQLSAAFYKCLGRSGARLALRLAGLIALGPIFAWYLLARAIYAMSNRAQTLNGSPAGPGHMHQPKQRAVRWTPTKTVGIGSDYPRRKGQRILPCHDRLAVFALRRAGHKSANHPLV